LPTIALDDFITAISFAPENIMRWFSGRLFAAVICFGLVGTAAAQVKKDAKADFKDKIVGVWEVVKSVEVPAGSVMEFAKDGKVTVTVQIQGRPIKSEANYAIEGDKVTILSKNREGKEMKHVDTIKTLTDSKLILTSPAGNDIEFKLKGK
jgi:uncharacterized protein (TIGR03066 family)